jgi:outer membrane immunogenic protein
MKKLMISVVAVVAMSSAVYGGGKLVEKPYVPPIPVVTDDWSGPYIGLQAGYIVGNGDMDYTRKVLGDDIAVLDYDEVKLYAHDIKPKGFIGGIFLGYNKLQKNDLLLGVELALNYTNISKAKYISITDGSNVDTSDTVRFKLKQKGEIALYGRIGKVIDNSYMPYLLAGVSATKLYGGFVGGSQEYWDKKTMIGFTAGAGVEYKINKDWHARVQYRYTKYGDKKFSYSIGNNITLKPEVSYNTHMIQIGISRKF